jgi:alpha-tubulin suppressor-like RCC1 family protein
MCVSSSCEVVCNAGYVKCGTACCTAVTLSSGTAHNCLVTNLGGVKCWGNNGYAQLGGSAGSPRQFPTDVPGLTAGVNLVAAGGDHTCVMMSTGGVKCWGRNLEGQVGDGSTASPKTAPTDVSFGAGVVPTALALGYRHSCALTATGKVKCWGANGNGQLGSGRVDCMPASRFQRT